MNAYIDGLAEQNDFVNTVSIGKSHEGRDMRVLQITKAGPGAPNVFIEAGTYIVYFTYSRFLFCIYNLMQFQK